VSGPRRIWASAAILAAVACVQENTRPRPRSLRLEQQQPSSSLSATRGSEHARGPRALEVKGGAAQPQETLRAEVPSEPVGANASPFHRFDWNLIRNADGTLTKLYYFRSQPTGPGATAYVDLLKRFIPGFAGLAPDQDYWVKDKFVIDPRKESHETWRFGSDIGLALGAGVIADLLMVTASEDMLRQIDEFLGSVTADVPQIEIETTIVEIALSDDLFTGIQATISRAGENNLIEEISIELAQDLVRGTFGTFHAVQDETVVNGLIEFLQTHTNSEVLSSPKLAVLNGHRAVIDTGQETPFFTPTFNAAGIQAIQTQFKPTGISVVVTPFILTADVVQLEISVQVSAVTGFVEAGVGSDAAVENPLISRRNAHTVVNVPSGKTVMIGGLVATEDIDSVEKVPLLGDIPLLGYLFKRKSTTYRKAQVLFFVKPRVVERRFREGEMYDPTEDFRR
jgi:type II secretory pathway component GspD/PulD (secretin)